MAMSADQRSRLERTLSRYCCGTNLHVTHGKVSLNYRMCSDHFILLEEQSLAPYLVDEIPVARISFKQDGSLRCQLWICESQSWGEEGESDSAPFLKDLWRELRQSAEAGP
jgi:hypothetical protein